MYIIYLCTLMYTTVIFQFKKIIIINIYTIKTVEWMVKYINNIYQYSINIR